MSALHQGADATLAAQLTSRGLAAIDGHEMYSYVTMETATQAWVTVVDKLSLWRENTEQEEGERSAMRSVLSVERWSGLLGMTGWTSAAGKDRQNAERILMVRHRPLAAATLTRSPWVGSLHNIQASYVVSNSSTFSTERRPIFCNAHGRCREEYPCQGLSQALTRERFYNFL